MIKSKLSFKPRLVQEKIAKDPYTIKSHLSRPHTLSTVKVSKQHPSPALCFWHTTPSHPPTVRTVPVLLGKASLDGKPPPLLAATSSNSLRYILGETLSYCWTVWSNTSNSNNDKLQEVQNLPGRVILGLRKYEHISDGLRSLKWLPIREKLILNDVTMMHKCINKLVPDYLADMFKLRSQVHNRQTRSTGALDTSLCSLSTGQPSFAFRGAKLWSSLNINISP